MSKPTKPSQRYRETQAELAEHKAQADALFASIGDGAVAIDQEGKISNINRVALHLLGWEKDELIGSWFPGTVVATNEKGEPIEYLERPIARAIISGSPVSSRSFYRCKDGSLLPVYINVSPILLNDRPIGAIEVFRDITEELEVDKMKSDFISIASHQLRTPATAVKNYIGLLREGYAGKLTKEQMEFINMAYESNERQIAVVNDLLHVAQTESSSLMLKKQPTDIGQLIKEVIKEQLETIESRQQTVSYQAPKKSVRARVDRSYFRMVIENLLSNASKYTPTKGKVTVDLTASTHEVVLRVKDTGVGISPADLDKLFKKFTRIDNPLSVLAGGTGIGLYLIKQIIDLHDGTISVKSAVKKGTEFTVIIPKS